MDTNTPLSPTDSSLPTTNSPPLSSPSSQPQSVVQPPSPPPSPKFKLPLAMWEKTQSAITKLEEKLSGRVISYFTSSSISSDDVKYFHAHLKKIGFQEKLYFIIVSSGGDGKSAYRIASLLRHYCRQLVVIIPEKAASAATMLSLAADQIIMTPLAYLTAVDTSLTHPLNPKDVNNRPISIEIEEIRRAVNVLLTNQKDDQDKSEIYKSIFTYVHPVAFGALERTSNLSEMLCSDILELRQSPLNDNDKATLINKLNKEYPAHGYPITKHKAKQLGLPVVDSDDQLDDLLWDFLNANRVATDPARTDLSDSYFHTEKMLNIIESSGMRFAVKNIWERRLDPVLKAWTTTQDDYVWISFSMGTDQSGKPILKSSRVDF